MYQDNARLTPLSLCIHTEASLPGAITLDRPDATALSPSFLRYFLPSSLILIPRKTIQDASAESGWGISEHHPCERSVDLLPRER